MDKKNNSQDSLVPPNMRRLINNIESTGNIYALDPDERQDWADLLDIEDLIPETTDPEIVFFVGCVYSYDPKLMQVTGDIIKLLNAAKVSFTLLGGNETCCGAPYFLNGANEKAQKFADQNVSAIKAHAPKYVITGCPSCYRSLRFIYPEMGYQVPGKVLHTTEYLDKLIWEGRLKLTNPVNKTVTYHDPCELGRLSGIYRAPRRILERIPALTFLEIPDYARDRGRCCGGGGAVKAVYPQLSDKMAEIRLWDIDGMKDSIDIISTACPQCEANLSSVATRTGKAYQVLDIASLMVLALPENTK